MKEVHKQIAQKGGTTTEILNEALQLPAGAKIFVRDLNSATALMKRIKLMDPEREVKISGRFKESEVGKGSLANVCVYIMPKEGTNEQSESSATESGVTKSEGAGETGNPPEAEPSVHIALDGGGTASAESAKEE